LFFGLQKFLRRVCISKLLSVYCKLRSVSRISTEQEASRMNIYVGNLSREVTEDDLRQAFEGFGQITSVNIIKDKFSGQSRGFGFVEMPGRAEAQAAIAGLNGKELKGRTLSVNEARPQSERREGGSGGGSRGRRSGGGGGGGRGPGGGGGKRSGGHRGW
jgi:cold-inducible RNA-binding protein